MIRKINYNMVFYLNNIFNLVLCKKYDLIGIYKYIYILKIKMFDYGIKCNYN